MTRKKKNIYKKKGNIVKDLTKNIFKILNEDIQNLIITNKFLIN